jgi:hypothetical protein
VIILISKTGSGKTTLIYTLSGIKLRTKLKYSKTLKDSKSLYEKVI